MDSYGFFQIPVFRPFDGTKSRKAQGRITPRNPWASPGKLLRFALTALGLGLAFPSLASAKLPLVAVEDFSARGVSANDAAIITDRLRSELLQTGKVRVLERGEMDKILKEQGFQGSGACDNSECGVEVGKLLSVDRMAVGSVGKIGELYTLSVRLLDVGTGEILFTSNQDFGGKLEGLLTESVPILAAKLSVGAQRIAGGAVAPEVRFGDLYVTTQDSNATLTLDGKPVTGHSPFSLEKVEVGTHLLVAQAKNLYGTVEVTLGPGDLKKVSIPMQVGQGSLKLRTDPEGARIVLDETEVGETPSKLEKVTAGIHRVTFKKFGFLDSTAIVEIANLVDTFLQVRLVPGGLLTISAQAMVQIRLVQGHDTVYTVTGHPVALRTGKWQLSVRTHPWEPIEEIIEIQALNQEHHLKIEPNFAWLSVTTNRPGEIFLDGKVLGKTLEEPGSSWKSDSLVAGAHHLRLTSPQSLPWEKEVSLQKGATTAIPVAFEWTPEELARQRSANRWGWRIGLGSAALLSAATGATFDSRVESNNDKAKKALSDYQNAKANFADYKSRYVKATNDAESDAKIAKIAYEVAGVFLLGIGFTWVF